MVWCAKFIRDFSNRKIKNFSSLPVHRETDHVLLHLFSLLSFLCSFFQVVKNYADCWYLLFMDEISISKYRKKRTFFSRQIFQSLAELSGMSKSNDILYICFYLFNSFMVFEFFFNKKYLSHVLFHLTENHIWGKWSYYEWVRCLSHNMEQKKQICCPFRVRNPN